MLYLCNSSASRQTARLHDNDRIASDGHSTGYCYYDNASLYTRVHIKYIMYQPPVTCTIRSGHFLRFVDRIFHAIFPIHCLLLYWRFVLYLLLICVLICIFSSFGERFFQCKNTVSLQKNRLCRIFNIVSPLTI